MSATTEAEVAAPPAPGPISVSSMVSASMAMALVTPSTPAITLPCRTRPLPPPRGVQALLEAGPGALGNAEKFNAISALFGGLQIGERDRFDSPHVPRLGIDLAAKGETGQDRKLVGGIEAADVEGRIGLGIAELLRLLQASRERQSLLVHPGQDIVAGAAQNAVESLHSAAT